MTQVAELQDSPYIVITTDPVELARMLDVHAEDWFTVLGFLKNIYPELDEQAVANEMVRLYGDDINE